MVAVPGATAISCTNDLMKARDSVRSLSCTGAPAGPGRSPLPLHHSWASWLWQRGLAQEEITPLQTVGLVAYHCHGAAVLRV